MFDGKSYKDVKKKHLLCASMFLGKLPVVKNQTKPIVLLCTRIWYLNVTRKFCQTCMYLVLRMTIIFLVFQEPNSCLILQGMIWIAFHEKDSIVN